MPKSYPDFPHHTHIAEYFDDYVDHFGFRDRITFETGRRARGAARRTAAGRSRSTAASTRALRRADRRQRPPLGRRAGRSPRSPGSERSRACRCTRTSTRATTRRFFRGKRVVVLGMGNSAMDIAVEASFSRRGDLPRRAPRRVGDPEVPVRPAARPDLDAGAASRCASARRSSRRCCRSASATWSATGCRSPTTGSARRTRRSRTTSCRASRTARSRRSRTSHALTERTVVFADGSEVEADVVVYCTGYKVHVPVLRPGADRGAGQRPAAVPARVPPGLGERVLHRPAAAARRDHAARRSCSRSGCADYLAGRYALPARRELRADIDARARSACSSATCASKRHTMQVDFDDYLADLAKERRRGAERARARATGCPCRRGRCEARPHERSGGRAARAHQGGEPRRHPRRRARRVRRGRLRARPACATSSAAPTSPRARSTTTSRTRTRSSARSWRTTGAEARRRVRAARAAGATTPQDFVEGGYRAFFEFIVEDPEWFAFMRRNLDTLRTRFGDAVLPAGTDELAEDLRAGDRRRRTAAASTSTTAPTRWSRSRSSSGRGWSSATPPDVDGATRFAVGAVPRRARYARA